MSPTAPSAWRPERPNRTTILIITFTSIAGAVLAGCLLALEGLHSQGLI